MNCWAKGCKKLLNSWKSTKNHRFGQNFATFRANYHVFAFRWTFQKKVAKSASFREEKRETIDLARTGNFSSKLPCLGIFDELFRKEVAKSASFREKARKTINLAKTFHFSKKLPCLGIFLNFWSRSCKNCLIPWKTTRIHRFGKNYATFSNKLPCFGASVNFSAKVCRKWLNSWKSTKNHRFGQNFATFQTNYHVFAFRWTFQEKVAKSASFREKARETIDLAKTFDFSKKLPFLGIFLNFWARSWKNCLIPWKSTRIHRFGQNYDTFCNKLPCFGVSMNFSAKGCRKWINSWKSTRNHRYGQLFATFPTNYHVFAFRWTFQKKVAKSASFREEKRETIDLARTGNFSSKLPCLGIFMNFSERSCKKCLISWESTRNNRFHQNLQLFEKTTMFLRLDELYGKKLQKLPHFVKKHENSSIWPKLFNFSNKLPCLCFRSTFQEKVAESASFREKARKTNDLAKTFNFSSKLPCLGIFMNFSERSCKKCLILWESTRNNRFYPKLQLFEKATMFLRLDELYGKKLKKLPHFVKKQKNSSIWPKLCNFFKQTTMFWCFDKLFSKSLQKVARFVKKHEKSSIWPKLCNFSNKLPSLFISMNFSGKSCKKCLIS